MQTFRAAAASVRNYLGEKEKSTKQVDDWSAMAAAQGAELILFPELNVTGYSTSPFARQIAETVPGPSTEKIIEIAGKREITICFGVIEQDGGNYHCTHVLVNGNGIIGKQRKIHVPVQEQGIWSAGNSIEVFDIGKAKIGISICRDSFFDEMTRTLYFKGAEVVLMPFGYYNVPRSRYLQDSIHGMSIIKASWTNGYYCVVCNSAEGREPSEWEPNGSRFPGWAGVFSPWGRKIRFIEDEGNSEALVVEELTAEELEDRRCHPNFLAKELRPELYQFV
jgi:N-carbamoylputrescine amidase